MNRQELDNQMRELEYYHSLRLVPGAWIVVRVEECDVAQLAAADFDQPYDRRLYDVMIQTGQALLRELQGVYAYIESNAVSVLCPPDWSLYDRSLERVVSRSVGLASANFSALSKIATTFDGRVWVGANSTQVIDYFSWRQADTLHRSLHDWCYWTLIGLGKTPAEAQDTLYRQPAALKYQLLGRQGIQFDQLPRWQRAGTGLYWQMVARPSHKRWSLQEVFLLPCAQLQINDELPIKADYRCFMEQLLTTVVDN